MWGHGKIVGTGDTISRQMNDNEFRKPHTRRKHGFRSQLWFHRLERYPWWDKSLTQGQQVQNTNWRVGWKNSLSQKLRKMFLKLTIAVISIYLIDSHEICRIVCEWHWQSILQISWKSMRLLSTAMVNFQNIFLNFWLRLFFHPTLQLQVLSNHIWNLGSTLSQFPRLQSNWKEFEEVEST